MTEGDRTNRRLTGLTRVWRAFTRTTARAATASPRAGSWVRRRGGQVRVLASGIWNRLCASLRQAAVWTITVPVPRIFFILWFNEKRVTRQPSVPAERVRRAQKIDKDASIALWQADTDRLNGLAAKAGAVLAADALVGAGLATQTDSNGWALVVCIACVVYLVSGAAAACVVQMPMRRQFLLPVHVLDGDVERRMIEVVVGNEALGIRTQNLVSVAVRDTFISLVALLLVLLLNLRA